MTSSPCLQHTYLQIQSKYLRIWVKSLRISEVCSNLTHTLGLMCNFDGGNKSSLAQGYFSSKYSSCWIEVEPPQTFQVYLSSNLSYFTTDIHSGRRNSDTERMTDRQTDRGGVGKWRDPGKQLGMKEKWEETGRTNLSTDQGKHVYTGREHHHQAGQREDRLKS